MTLNLRVRKKNWLRKSKTVTAAEGFDSARVNVEAMFDLMRFFGLRFCPRSKMILFFRVKVSS